MNVYLEDILNGFLIPTLQELYDSQMSILTVYDIDRMEGKPLKKIADMVGLKVSHNDLEIYRTLIKGRCVANTALGTVDDIANVLNILFTKARRIEYNTCILVEVQGDYPSDDLYDAYFNIIQDCLPAGVALISLVFYNDDTLIYNVGKYDEKYYS